MQLESQNVTSYNGVTELQPADVATDIQLVESSTIQSIVSSELGALAPKVTAAEVPTTDVLELSVSSKSPVYAARVANDYVNAYIKFTTNRYAKQVNQQENILKKQQTTFQNEIKQIETEIASVGPKSSDLTSLNSQLSSVSSQLQTVTNSLTNLQLDLVQVPAGAFSVTPAVPNYAPTSPKKVLDILLAIILGLLLAGGIALLFDFFDDRIRSKDQLQAASGGLPLLGEIPFFDDWADQPDNAVDRCRTTAIGCGRVIPKSPHVNSVHRLRSGAQQRHSNHKSFGRRRQDDNSHRPGGYSRFERHQGGHCWLRPSKAGSTKIPSDLRDARAQFDSGRSSFTRERPRSL